MSYFISLCFASNSLLRPCRDPLKIAVYTLVAVSNEAKVGCGGNPSGYPVQSSLVPSQYVDTHEYY